MTELIELERLCSNCDRESSHALASHYCPFQSEIYNDDEFRCECCSECMEQCSGDI